MGTMAVMTTCLSSERQSASWKRISPVSGKRFPSPSTRMERHSSAGFEGNLLPGAGGPSGVSPGVPGGGTGQREEPPAHSHPLPPGHRRGRNPGRLFQRSGAQAVSAEAGRALHPRVQTAQTGGKTGGESPVRRCPTSRPAGLLSGERRLAGFPSEKPLSQAKRCLGQGFAVFEMERDRKETGAPLGINVCLSGGSPLARLSALLAHHPGIRRMTRSKAPFSGQPCRPRL